MKVVEVQTPAGERLWGHLLGPTARMAARRVTHTWLSDKTHHINAARDLYLSSVATSMTVYTHGPPFLVRTPIPYQCSQTCTYCPTPDPECADQDAGQMTHPWAHRPIQNPDSVFPLLVRLLLLPRVPPELPADAVHPVLAPPPLRLHAGERVAGGADGDVVAGEQLQPLPAVERRP